MDTQARLGYVPEVNRLKMAESKIGDQVVVTLPSNSSMDKYRQNKPTEYRVVLRSALDFGNAHQDWEVALVYAQFT